jgi:hypothetical protein
MKFAVILVAITILTLACTCAPTPKDSEKEIWRAYSGPDAREALAAEEVFKTLLWDGVYAQKYGSGVPYLRKLTELRLFALAYYLGETHLMEEHFKQYTNLLFSGSAKPVRDISASEAILSLQLLEQNLEIKWKHHTNELVHLPPSQEAVEQFATSLGIRPKSSK